MDSDSLRRLIATKITQSAELRKVVSDFAIASGISLRLLAAGEESPNTGPHGDATWIENPFCRSLCGSAQCGAANAALTSRMASTPSLQRLVCWAGFQHMAVPVLLGGVHVATLEGGMVATSKPNRTDVLKVLKYTEWKPGELSEMLYSTPVFSERRMEAIENRLKALAMEISAMIHQMSSDHAVIESGSVRKAITYAKRHLGDSISTRDVAEHVRLNKQYFCEIFRKATGRTFLAYLNELRLEKAFDMLTNSKRKTVAEIAFESGFQSMPAFYSAFRRAYQTTPSTVRCQAMKGSKANIQDTLA